MKFGLIAGNGKFPFMVLEGAKRAGASLAIVAIHEETDSAIDSAAEAAGGRVIWVGIGQLGKMIRFFKGEGVEQAMMAGQVKHVQIFSGAVPDARMLKMILRLPRRNTNALIGAVADELSREGIELIDSTHFLQDQLPQPGTLTKREPSERERGDIEYGLEIAREIARLDLGQTIVIRAKACVAIEAMEGTDATIRRAGEVAWGRSEKRGRIGGSVFAKVGPYGSETCQARSGHAVRRARRWRAYDREHDCGRRHLSLRYCRQDTDVRSR